MAVHEVDQPLLVLPVRATVLCLRLRTLGEIATIATLSVAAAMSVKRKGEASQANDRTTGRQIKASTIPLGCLRFECGCPRRQKAAGARQVLGKDLSQDG